MQDAYDDLSLLDNEYDQQFEFQVGEYLAFIEYERTLHFISLIHTEVPAEIAGHGVGTAIVEKTLQHIESLHLKMIPLCPFVAGFVLLHPEWRRLIAPGYQHHFD
jgi:predicted GNAT family acetyltransferase